jgi:membrane protease subunit HflC
MRISRKNIFLGLVVLIVMAAILMFYQVDTTEFVILTRFGQPVRAIKEPGLNVKLPDPIESVQRTDNRLQVFQMPQTEFLTHDKKNINIETYATWQVTDPLLFLKSVRNKVGAEVQLADILRSELGVVLGRVNLDQLVTISSEGSQIDSTLAEVTERTDQRARSSGFRVTDVRLTLLTFPEAARQSVFQRMRTEREAIARKFRSEGEEEAAKIRAQADTQAAIILSQAQRDANRLQGEADALAIRIYAQAFGQAPEFYKFLRTLEAYETFLDEQTVLVLPADSALLQYLNPSAVGIVSHDDVISPTASTESVPTAWLSPTLPITELLPAMGVTSTVLITTSAPSTVTVAP